MKWSVFPNLVKRGWKMKLRAKLIFLTVSLLFFSLGMIMHFQKVTNYQRLEVTLKPTMATVLIYHVRNLTYIDELNDSNVKMNDPLLITAIREKFLWPPSPRNVPYKLKDPGLKYSFMEHAEAIANMLDFQINGFFVEARAFDGETWSNTLLLEHRLNWEGLLVEPDPINFAQIIEKNRKAWVSHSCLSIRTYPHVTHVSQDLGTRNNSKFPAGQKNIGLVDVQCLPLYSLLLALNRTTVDYLSLNVKGNEVDILKTIPFKDLNIRTLSVDYLYQQKGKSIMMEYMENQGYYVYETLVHRRHTSILFMFVKHEV